MVVTLQKLTDKGFHGNFKDNLSLKHNFVLKCQGSEARVYQGQFLGKPSILKERFVKKYRHPDLDKTLTLERMKSEVRALNKCRDVCIRAPVVYFIDLETRCIIMQEIVDSTTVKQYLTTAMEKDGVDSINNMVPLAQKIAQGVAKMHSNQIVHGDLTTSNMLLKSKDLTNPQEEFEVYFVDFGLAKRDVTTEDMAVDLYVLERAIASSHPNSDRFNSCILRHYLKAAYKSNAIFAKLEEVKHRGRKRTMVG